MPRLSRTTLLSFFAMCRFHLQIASAEGWKAASMVRTPNHAPNDLPLESISLGMVVLNQKFTPQVMEGEGVINKVLQDEIIARTEQDFG